MQKKKGRGKSYNLYSHNLRGISQKIYFGTEALQWNKGLFDTDHNIQYLDVSFVLKALPQAFRNQHKELWRSNCATRHLMKFQHSNTSQASENWKAKKWQVFRKNRVLIHFFIILITNSGKGGKKLFVFVSTSTSFLLWWLSHKHRYLVTSLGSWQFPCVWIYTALRQTRNILKPELSNAV